MLSCFSLMLAVTTTIQATPSPAPKPRAHPPPMTAVGPVTDGPVTVAPLIAASGQIEAAAMQLQMQLQMAQPDFAMLSAQAPALAMSAQALQAPAYALTGLSDLAGLYGLAGLATLADLGDIGDAAELELVWPQDDVSTQADVADSVYRIARQALNDHQYNRAASLFRTLRDRYPRSTYVGNSYYWQAFALYRLGSDSALDAGRDALHMQSIRYPKATTRRDAEVLMRRIQGALARSGDADAAAALTAEAESLAPEAPTVAAAPSVGPTPPIPAIAPAPRGRYHLHDDACDDEDDIRIAALNAVLQMDADRAVPLLKTVLARRDAGSVCLRRKAVFLVSQKHTDETSRILLDVVRSDPDQEVREQGVFWLSQVPGDETVAALDSILQDPKSDPQIQEKAIFALSQHRSPRAAAILCSYAGRRDRPSDLREKAIFWLGQRRSDENTQCLRDLYKKLDNDDLKEKVIFSLSQMGGADNYRWLMDIALNQNEDIELRKKALFWAGQGHSVDVDDLVRLYDSMKDREMREQLIFVYSQRREEAAVVKLCQIGKTDPDRELRKKAVFWLGQSRSATAGQCLQELINQ